jgi:hypothetical protein
MSSLCFDKAAYQAANDQIISLVKNSHDWEHTEGFIADGVICPDEYEKQPMRVLCFLAESYGYDGCKMTSIECQPDLVLGLANKSVKAPRKLSTLLWLIQSSVEKGYKIKQNDMPKLFRINNENTTKLQNTLKKVAWVNVKKASRAEGTAMVEDEVFQHALRNQAILRMQLEATAPHLIVVCGKVVFRALNEMKLLGAEIVPGRLWEVQSVNCGPRVVEVSHPRNWWGYEKLYQHFDQIFAQLS